MGVKNGFRTFDLEATRAENLEKYPWTLGLVSYKTVKTVSLKIALALGLISSFSLPGEKMPTDDEHSAQMGKKHQTDIHNNLATILSQSHLPSTGNK